MNTPATPISLLTNFTGSPSAILASVKRKGLPQINQDEMKMQLASPTVSMKNDDPVRLHLIRTATPTSSKPAEDTTKNQKKKAVVFNDEREYLQTPTNKRRPSLQRQNSTEKKIKKGILIKHKKNSSVAGDIRHDIAIEKSRNSSPMQPFRREKVGFDSGRLEAMLMGVSDKGPATFREAVNIENANRYANSTPRKTSKDLFVKNRAEDSGSQQDKSQRDDTLDEIIRKKFEQDFSTSDLLRNGSSPGFSTPLGGTPGYKESPSIFKSVSLKKDVFPSLRPKYQLEPKATFNPSPIPSSYMKNNAKIGLFNVGAGGSSEPARGEMSSFRSILNGSTLPSEITRSQRTKSDMIKMTKIDAAEDRILTLENPYENFIKKNNKVSAFNVEANRSNFMMANANNILKRDAYKSEAGLPFVPKLDLFPQYKMAVATNPYNSPRK